MTTPTPYGTAAIDSKHLRILVNNSELHRTSDTAEHLKYEHYRTLVTITEPGQTRDERVSGDKTEVVIFPCRKH